MLKLTETLLYLRLAADKALKRHLGGLVGIGIWEANWDVNCEDVIAGLELLRDQRRQNAVSAKHFHLKQTVEAVLSARRVESELRVGGLPAID